MYHRVAEAGAAATARYGVTPAAFDEQLRYLREAGFRGVELDEWSEAMELRRPLPGRAIMITFDHGYRDFLDQAWPLLQRQLLRDRLPRQRPGRALERMGQRSWRGAAAADLGRDPRAESRRCRLWSALGQPPSFDGVGACRHRARPPRAALQRGLGRPVTAFAYPHGDNDATVRHLVGACGFAYGLTCRREWSAFGDDLLDLPRMEIDGSDTLETFVAKLSPAEPTRSKRLTVSSVG